ncbi:MAG TPA: heavy metal translocating P-type ATPase metal-binding domain-containing protein [Chitinophagaceae bacterium]|nr:heavy metal translocating P-type ATPase metal-binding domain-containing protein [Chitinophagaceae bacterium]
MPVTATKVKCYHCGEECSGTLQFDDKPFCCDGCKMVYSLLNKSNLCAYYDYNETPGINRKKEVRQNKFAFLDDAGIAGKLISFSDGKQTHVTLYLPQIHCSSCLYLLENLHKIDANIISSRINFTQKEITIIFSAKTTLRQVAELLTSIGYEPYLSLNNIKEAKPKVSRAMIYRLGIAGFCFANIMLLSFPEYLGLNADDVSLKSIFRLLNVILSLPVIIYSAQPFYKSAWGGIKHAFLNIDAPIVVAIFVTFGRSLYEIISGSGSGYFDSMTGIVFFMLAGRVLQDRTYGRLSFARDYTDYFPIAVTVINRDNEETPVALPAIKTGDTLLIHNDELVPADGILTRGKAWIDYSFVTGESVPVLKEMGEIIYAGGKQLGNNIEILTIKEVSQSYLTSLWDSNTGTETTQKENSFVHILSRYFTYIVFAIAAATAIYWAYTDASKLWNAVTAILIIACPCALLLSYTFTNGNILAILSGNRFFLKNAQTIQNIASANSIVFDKTGTLTYADVQHIEYRGEPLTFFQQKAIATLASQSNHPLSRAIAKKLGKDVSIQPGAFTETPGMGIMGIVQGRVYRIGSELLIKGSRVTAQAANTSVFVSEDDKLLGCFEISNEYRQHIDALVAKLQKKYSLYVLSGDNDNEKQHLQKIMGDNATIYFHQKPGDKLHFIKTLQDAGNKVMMIGDGLNDGPSLKQSDVGIAVSDGANNFTPACDAIIDARRLDWLYRFITLCKANKRIIMASFILSILYNIIGLYYAVHSSLSPLIAAILMPASSLSILLVTYGSSKLYAKILGLGRKE